MNPWEGGPLVDTTTNRNLFSTSLIDVIFFPLTVIDLIYWRDVKKTGVVFGSMLVLLLSLALFSVLSVVAYLSLAGLTVTISFCVYKKVLGAVQKTGEGHPFKQYLDVDIAIPEEKVNQLADHVVNHLTANARELRRLFLVEDLVDSLKVSSVAEWKSGFTVVPPICENKLCIILLNIPLTRGDLSNKARISIPQEWLHKRGSLYSAQVGYTSYCLV